MLGNISPAQTDEYVAECFKKTLATLSNAKNVTDLKDIQINIKKLERSTFKGALELAEEYKAVLAERIAFVKARYEQNGWSFNF
jgi:hypothetical protein